MIMISLNFPEEVQNGAVTLDTFEFENERVFKAVETDIKGDDRLMKRMAEDMKDALGYDTVKIYHKKGAIDFCFESGKGEDYAFNEATLIIPPSLMDRYSASLKPIRHD